MTDTTGGKSVSRTLTVTSIIIKIKFSMNSFQAFSNIFPLILLLLTIYSFTFWTSVISVCFWNYYSVTTSKVLDRFKKWYSFRIS